MIEKALKSRTPLPSLLVALLLLPVMLGAWGRFGLKVPAAFLLSLGTGIIIRFFSETGSKAFPWAMFWVFPLFAPLGMPLWLVPTALLAGWLIAVSAFGGSGKNIFNPVAVALVFLIAGYGSSVSLLASKPFSGATSAFAIWTAGMNPVEPACRIWLARPLNSRAEFFAGGHLPSIPGLAFPGILLVLAGLLVLVCPGRRVWFVATLAFTALIGVVVENYWPGYFFGVSRVFAVGSYAAVLWLALVDEATVPQGWGAQILFALLFAPLLVLFVCNARHELAPVYALLLTQALFPLLHDLCGAST